jgi:hypothetical protein
MGCDYYTREVTILVYKGQDGRIHRYKEYGQEENHYVYGYEGDELADTIKKYGRTVICKGGKWNEEYSSVKISVPIYTEKETEEEGILVSHHVYKSDDSSIFIEMIDPNDIIEYYTILDGRWR